MALHCRSMFYRRFFQSLIVKPCELPEGCRFSRRVSSTTERARSNFWLKNLSSPVKLLVAGVPLSVFGGGCYYYYKSRQYEKALQEIVKYEEVTTPYTLLEFKPNVPIARRVKGVGDHFNLQLILFQYPTCPFCCKVRAFLDYYGLPYDVVEVDPVLRQQTSWTTYKKVPIVLAKVEGGYKQLNDSTMIISALKSFLMKDDRNLEDIVNYYPIVNFKDIEGNVKPDIVNKYFLMYEENLPKSKTTEMVKEEKTWREWADNSLVHTLSPNVYRTWDESLEAFKWFSEVGEWERLFPSWERNIIVYVGALAMWIIGKRLKKRHQLLDDERESLYQECRKWMKAISAKQTTFLGGNSPNLADLAVYGVLSSIEGCLAFNDLLEHTTIRKWYYPMKEAVENHAGKNEISYKKE